MLPVTAGPPNVVIIFSATKAAIVISKRIQSDALGDDSLDGLLTLGQYLLGHHQEHCKHGVLVDTAEDLNSLRIWFQGTVDDLG